MKEKTEKKEKKIKSWCFKSNKTELSRTDNQGMATIEEQEDSKITSSQGHTKITTIYRASMDEKT